MSSSTAVPTAVSTVPAAVSTAVPTVASVRRSIAASPFAARVRRILLAVLSVALESLGAAVLFSASAAAAGAQDAPATPAATAPAPAPASTSRWELNLNSGKLIPTGAQKDEIDRGNLSAAQLFFAVRPAFAVTASVGWARSRDVTLADDPKLDLFTYDVGAEVRGSVGTKVTFRPFAGVGAGARSSNHRSLDIDATHVLAAYGSAGGELGYGRGRLRIEVRDYVTGFEALGVGDPGHTRNDVAVLIGLSLAAR